MSGRLAAVLLVLTCLFEPAWAAPLVAKGEATPLAAWALFCKNIRPSVPSMSRSPRSSPAPPNSWTWPMG